MPASKHVTYGSMARRLRSLGFTRQATKGKHLYYRHPDGAIILLPPGTDKTRLRPVHLTMIRSVLRDHNLVDDQWQPVA